MRICSLPCIRGHRSSTCNHSNRTLIRVRNRGRPASNDKRVAIQPKNQDNVIILPERPSQQSSPSPTPLFTNTDKNNSIATCGSSSSTICTSSANIIATTNTLTGAKVEKRDTKKNKKSCCCGPKKEAKKKAILAATSNNTSSTVSSDSALFSGSNNDDNKSLYDSYVNSSSSGCCGGNNSNAKKSKREVITIQGIVNQHYVEVNKNGTRILSEEELKREQQNKVYSFISENPGNNDTSYPATKYKRKSIDSTALANEIPLLEQPLGGTETLVTKLESPQPEAFSSISPSNFSNSPYKYTSSTFCCCGTDDCDCENCDGCKIAKDLESNGGTDYVMWSQDNYQKTTGSRTSYLDTAFSENEQTNTNVDQANCESKKPQDLPVFVNSFVEDFKSDSKKDNPGSDISKKSSSCCFKKEQDLQNSGNLQSCDSQNVDLYMLNQVSDPIFSPDNDSLVYENTKLSLRQEQVSVKPPNFILPMDMNVDEEMNDILSASKTDTVGNTNNNNTTNTNFNMPANNIDIKNFNMNDYNDISDIISFLETQRDSLDGFIPSPPLEMSFAPSCVLPGQCHCGDDCQCPGCSTHGDRKETVSYLYENESHRFKPSRDLYTKNKSKISNSDTTSSHFNSNLDATVSMPLSMPLNDSIMDTAVSMDNDVFSIGINNIAKELNLGDMNAQKTGLNTTRHNSHSEMSGINFLKHEKLPKPKSETKREPLDQTIFNNQIPGIDNYQQTQSYSQEQQSCIPENTFVFDYLNEWDNGNSNFRSSSHDPPIPYKQNKKDIEKSPTQYQHANSHHEKTGSCNNNIATGNDNQVPDPAVQNYLHTAISTLQSLLQHQQSQQQPTHSKFSSNSSPNNMSCLPPSVSHSQLDPSLHTSPHSRQPSNASEINTASVLSVVELLKKQLLIETKPSSPIPFPDAVSGCLPTTGAQSSCCAPRIKSESPTMDICQDPFSVHMVPATSSSALHNVSLASLGSGVLGPYGGNSQGIVNENVHNSKNDHSGNGSGNGLISLNSFLSYS